jgi:hypothetical protein
MSVIGGGARRTCGVVALTLAAAAATRQGVDKQAAAAQARLHLPAGRQIRARLATVAVLRAASGAWAQVRALGAPPPRDARLRWWLLSTRASGSMPCSRSVWNAPSTPSARPCHTLCLRPEAAAAVAWLLRAGETRRGSWEGGTRPPEGGGRTRSGRAAARPACAPSPCSWRTWGLGSGRPCTGCIKGRRPSRGGRKQGLAAHGRRTRKHALLRPAAAHAQGASLVPGHELGRQRRAAQVAPDDVHPHLLRGAPLCGDQGGGYGRVCGGQRRAARGSRQCGCGASSPGSTKSSNAEPARRAPRNL